MATGPSFFNVLHVLGDMSPETGEVEYRVERQLMILCDGRAGSVSPSNVDEVERYRLSQFSEPPRLHNLAQPRLQQIGCIVQQMQVWMHVQDKDDVNIISFRIRCTGALGYYGCWNAIHLADQV